MCHVFLFGICIYSNRIHFVYAHFSPSAVVGCRPSAKRIFRPRFSSPVFALLFISFFFFSLFFFFAFASWYSYKGAYYTDEFLLWLHLAVTLSLSSSLFRLLLFSSLLNVLFYWCHKKTEPPGRRTNEYRKALCLLLSSYSIISHNYAPVMFSRLNIYGL